ncbi:MULTISPECIES: AraC family transcriptional regulator [Paenibacillus]|uniref:AraC family transcriptional regulator n=1 Tax=Paenibacillus violae TaxID=3077234 RepID=A0ABU3R9Y2_9BACL|nr:MULTISPECIES: AraC family transcriptional regulator [Paenibacillus]MDU0200682.1 AraC family transcriptional regulator [Paenibacillus sp. PFR10]MEC0265452.1 AraC family transcriptional regulator [Paenibacillus anseongense]
MNKFGKHGPIYHLPQVGAPPPLSVQFLGVNYCESDYCNIRELAQVTVIGLVRSGQGTVKVGTRTSTARRGDVFILPAGCYHEVASDSQNEEQWSYIWLNISGNWILTMLEAYQLLPHIVVQNSGLEPLFHEAIDNAKHKSAQELQTELQVNLMRIIVCLSEVLRKQGDTLTSTVQSIKQFLDNSVFSPYDTSELSSQIGVSARHMNRLFKKEVGTTLYNYVIAKKIESAKRMLVDTQLTISEIGYKLGYVDPHYFSNLFHSKTNVRPSDFRKRFRAIQ